jgi:hypothetical protein
VCDCVWVEPLPALPEGLGKLDEPREFEPQAAITIAAASVATAARCLGATRSMPCVIAAGGLHHGNRGTASVAGPSRSSYLAQSAAAPSPHADLNATDPAPVPRGKGARCSRADAHARDQAGRHRRPLLARFGNGYKRYKALRRSAGRAAAAGRRRPSRPPVAERPVRQQERVSVSHGHIGLRFNCSTPGAAAVADQAVVTGFVRRGARVHTAVSGGAAIALIVIRQSAVARQVVAP